MTKPLTRTVVALSILLLMTGCMGPFRSDEADATQDGIVVTVPTAVVESVPRSYTAEEFEFQTVVEVPLRVDVRLYPAVSETGEAIPLTPEEIEAESRSTLATVYDDEGEVAFQTTFSGTNALQRTLVLPTGKQFYRLELSRPGYESRTIRLENAPQQKSISVIAHLRQQGPGSVSSSVAVEVDPRYNVPAGDDFFTVAYEDYFPHVGDADFNDFVVQYNIEVTEESGFVSQYTVNATARARAAGFEHEFGFVLQFPGFTGTYSVTYEQVVNGEIVSRTTDGFTQDSARIVLFPSTKSAFKRQSSTVTVDNGFLGEPLSEGLSASFTISFAPYTSVSPEDVEAPPLDPYLLTEKGYDVHLIGKPALDGSNNFDVPLSEWENFLDQNGYPRALLVPTAWPHPLEVTQIDSAYSDFTAWRSSNGAEQQDWYERPNAGLVFEWPENN